MIGSGFKKFARENGLQVDAGIGYGLLHGFQATLSEGAGYKQIVINTKFPDVEKLNALQAKLNEVNLQKEYRVNRLAFTPDAVVIVFLDNPGTMKKIEAFTNWFFPLLTEAEAYDGNICPACGTALNGSGVWKNVSGIARCYHSGCAEHLAQEIAAENSDAENQDTGTYASGAVGALLGAVLGGIVWGIVLYAGWIASLIGLLIAFVAEKGYTLLKGKQGPGKIVILIIAVVFGVALGTGFSLVLEIINVLNDTAPNWNMDQFTYVLKFVLADEAAVGEILRNFLSGLLFAGIGVVAFVVQAAKNIAKPKMKDLK